MIHLTDGSMKNIKYQVLVYSKTTGTFITAVGMSVQLLRKISWEYLGKLNIPYKPKISPLCSPKDMCSNVHSSSLQSHPKLKTSQMPIKSRMDKKIIVIY